MSHQFGCILWTAWLVRLSFATSAQLRSIERSIGLLESKVKADADSVAASGNTFSNLQTEALHFAAGFAPVTTTLQAHAGFLESKAKEETDSVSAGGHTGSNLPHETLVQKSLSTLVEKETAALQAQIGFLESKVKEEANSVSAGGHTMTEPPSEALPHSSLSTPLHPPVGPLHSKVKNDAGSVSAAVPIVQKLSREAMAQSALSPTLQARIGFLESQVKDGHTRNNLPHEALAQSSLSVRTGPLESKAKAHTDSVSPGSRTFSNQSSGSLVQSPLSTPMHFQTGPLESVVKADTASVSAGGYTSSNLRHETSVQSPLSATLQARTGPLELKVQEATDSVSAGGHISNAWSGESLVQSSLSTALQARIGHLETKVNDATDSVSTGGHTSNLWAGEALAESSLPTALQARIGHLESKIKEATDSVSADGHTFSKAVAPSSHSTTLQAPLLALLEKTQKTPLLWLMGVTLDRWGDKVNSSTESSDTFANNPFGQDVKAGLFENLVYKFASARSFNALQHVELFVGSLDQQRTLISLVLPVVLFAFFMALSCSRSSKPVLQACARTEEERQKQSDERPTEHYFRTTHVATGRIASDVACVHDNAVHFDIGQEADDILDHESPEYVRIHHIDVEGTFSADKVEFFDVSDCESEVGSTCSNLSKEATVPSCTSDEPSSPESLTSLMPHADETRRSVMSVPGDMCRACAERAPNMCRTCADSFEHGATLLPLPIRKQSEAMPPLPLRLQRRTCVEHPGIVTITPGNSPLAANSSLIEQDDVHVQLSQPNGTKDTDLDSEPEVTALDPAPFPELSQSDLSSFDTEKSKSALGGDGCQPSPDASKAAEAKPTLETVWFGLSTVDLFMETLGLGREPRASSQARNGYHVLDHLP